jgi:hypothetical protein
MHVLKTALIFAFGLSLQACGGGGTSSGGSVGTAPPPPPPAASGPTWTRGTFEAESTFINQCAAPRTGTNPATGQAFADRAGSVLLENHWLRSWSNNTYLWFDEINDQDPAGFSDRKSYFDVLKTTAITASGANKDRFHFSIDSAEYQQQVSSGASAGYGVQFALIATSVPRDIRIAFTEAGSPAATANLERGAVILTVDGVDAVNGGTQADVDVLNGALFPSAAGESHTFIVRDVGSATNRTITMVSEIVTSDPVNVAKTMDFAGGKIGYLHFTTFGTVIAEEALIDAFTQFSNDGISDLVLDLRYNGGGFLDISAQLGFMIAGAARTNGKIFDKTVFNSKHLTTNPVTGNPLTPTPFHATSRGFSVDAGQALPELALNRVFILSTSGTCSASEAVINGLRGIDVEVILIGSTTCGKPYGFFATDNCGLTYFSIQFKGENEKGFGDYTDGFTPLDAATGGEFITGCEIGDDFDHLLGDESEDQFAAALEYMQTGACPAAKGTASVKSAAKRIEDETSLMSSERLRVLQFLSQNRIDTPPSTTRN